MLGQGLRVYPHLKDASAGDNIRLFHALSVAANLIDVLSYPGKANTDKELASIITKIKGLWEYEEKNPLTS